MKQRTTLALVAMLAFVMAGQATILRVNPDPLSIAQYHDPVSAMSAAFPGDTIYVEGNAGTGVSGILSVYPVMTISKPLHFVGPGYFLAENNIYSDGMLIPEFSALLLTPAASGTTFNGLKIHQLQINNAACVAVHCFIGQLVMNNCTSGFFRKNYFYSNIGVTPVSLSGCSGIAFNNNFIGSSTLSDDGEITLDINLSPGVSFTNNTFAGGVCNTGGAAFLNNIFYFTQLFNYTASEFNNNLFWAGLSAPTLTISGNGNVFGADPLSFFETGVAVGDQQWQVPDTSPANGVADDGTQVGMFGGADPYVLSGLDLPVLSFGSVPPCFIVEQPGCVTFTFFSPDGIPMSNGEYIFDSDPGPGSGIDFGLTSAAGTVCFAISTVDLSTGFHRIAYRIRQSDGRWSHSREATFQVKPDDVLPVVNEIEYFIDEDPAFGLASPETNPLDGPLSEIVFTIPLSFLSVGPHNLWLRTKDENGNYSTTLSRTFLVLPDEPPLPPITQVEFVLDDDNGYGSGTGFAATGVNWESEYTIDLTDVPLGFHKLYVRERDVNGDFSTTQEKEIFVTIPGDLTQDFCVNVSDLIVFLGLFTCSAPEGYYCEGDFAFTPGFSLVNVSDLLLFMSYYGSGNCTGEVDVN